MSDSGSQIRGPGHRFGDSRRFGVRSCINALLAPLEILPFDDKAIWAYGDLRSNLERKGASIGAIDTMIAAHTLALDAILVTNNSKEFARVDGLRLENWVD